MDLTIKNDIRTRLRLFLDEKGMSMSHLERLAGLSQGYLRNGTGSYGVDKIHKITKILPELNLSWLVTGQGSMMNEGYDSIQKFTPKSRNKIARDNHDEALNDEGLFDGSKSLAEIENVDIASVPAHQQLLVKDIKLRKAKLDSLTRELAAQKTEIAQLRREKDAAIKEAAASKDKLIEVLLQQK